MPQLRIEQLHIYTTVGKDLVFVQIDASNGSFKTDTLGAKTHRHSTSNPRTVTRLGQHGWAAAYGSFGNGQPRISQGCFGILGEMGTREHNVKYCKIMKHFIKPMWSQCDANAKPLLPKWVGLSWSYHVVPRSETLRTLLFDSIFLWLRTCKLQHAAAFILLHSTCSSWTPTFHRESSSFSRARDRLHSTWDPLQEGTKNNSNILKLSTKISPCVLETVRFVLRVDKPGLGQRCQEIWKSPLSMPCIGLASFTAQANNISKKLRNAWQKLAKYILGTQLALHSNFANLWEDCFACFQILSVAEQAITFEKIAKSRNAQ